MKAAALALMAMLSGAPVAALAGPTGRASVIDGNTIEIRGQRIRLFGIDAPEGRQTCDRDGKPWHCGQNATFALANIIGRHWIRCVERDRDHDRRIVAICYLDKQDVGALMVRQGWALDYRPDSKGLYAGDEAEARQARRGVWAGQFTTPWDRRQGHDLAPPSDRTRRPAEPIKSE